MLGNYHLEGPNLEPDMSLGWAPRVVGRTAFAASMAGCTGESVRLNKEAVLVHDAGSGMKFVDDQHLALLWVNILTENSCHFDFGTAACVGDMIEAGLL